MKKKESRFYLVDYDILPEGVKKAIRVKEMLKNGTCGSINEAVKQVEMSRSAYYKYKDHVAPALEPEKERRLVLFLVMNSDPAVLARVLRRVGKDKNSILSLSCGAPMGKKTAVTITAKTEESLVNLKYLEESLNAMRGVESLIMKAGGDLA